MLTRLTYNEALDLLRRRKGHPINHFEQLRHRPLRPLNASRPLIVACCPLKSHVNLSTIIRTAGCCAVQEIIASGHAKLSDRIARDAVTGVALTVRSSLPPVLKALKAKGYNLVGLEQATNSVELSEFTFSRKTVLVVGSERGGVSPACLKLLDAVVEISVWGMPYSHNVATATSLALYEYCRQFPDG
jgi:tRNA G18 (ribose-2'-O)-methylase SpoU